METKLESIPQHTYEGRTVSAMGFRLRAIREQIEASAARGETTLLNGEELERELSDSRRSDPSLR